MAESISTQLQQILITHQVYLEKYKTYESNKMLQLLRDADRELKAILESKSDIKNWTDTRIKKLQESVQKLESEFASAFSEEITGEMKAFADRETDWLVTQMDKLIKPYFAYDFTAITAAQVYAAAESSFLIMQDGITLDLESIISSVFSSRSQIIEQSLRQGFILGKSIDQMVDEILGTEALNYFDGNLKKARDSCERVVRTAFSHISATASDEVYKNNTDLIKGYKWVSTLDTRTCFIKGHNILTPFGNKEITEIKIGDIIFNGKREKVEVIGTCNKEVTELIEIELGNGKIIRCTPDHLFKLSNGEWIEAQSLLECDDLQEGI